MMSKNQIHWTWAGWQTMDIPLVTLHLCSRSET